MMNTQKGPEPEPQPRPVARERVSYVVEGQALWRDDHAMIGAACSAGEGHWYCATHREPCHTNLDRDRHVDDDRSHLLAWVCYHHGLEQP